MRARRTRLHVLLTLAFGLCLTACAAPPPPAPPVVRVERLAVPAGLLTCAGHPEPPVPPVRDADVARYIQALAMAGDDCRDRLARVAEVVAPL